MRTNADVIESLSRKLERARVLNDLKDHHTLEDLKGSTKKYELMCDDDKKEK